MSKPVAGETPDTGNNPLKLPLSRVVDLRKLPDLGKTISIELDALEGEAMKSFYDLVDLEHFSAELHLKPVGRKRFVLEGKVQARLSQSCVVTFEPVADEVKEVFEIILVPEEDLDKYLEKVDTDGSFSVALDEDVPDTYKNGEVDVAELALEHFALGLNPYPHAPGVKFKGHKDSGDVKENPFAQLVTLKNKLKPN